MKKRDPLELPKNNVKIGNGITSPMEIPSNHANAFATQRNFISASMPTSIFSGAFQQQLQATSSSSHRPIMPRMTQFDHHKYMGNNVTVPIFNNPHHSHAHHNIHGLGVNPTAILNTDDEVLLPDALFPLSIENVQMEEVDNALSIAASPLDVQMLADDYLDLNSSNDDVISSSMPESTYSHTIPHSPVVSYSHNGSAPSGGGIFAVPPPTSANIPSSVVSHLSNSLDLQGSNDSLSNQKSGEDLDKHVHLLEKQRKRRESHNAVERRRRDNINDRIQELGILVPDCETAKQNKGTILRKTTDYIRHLQKTNQSLLLQVQKLEKELASTKESK